VDDSDNSGILAPHVLLLSVKSLIIKFHLQVMHCGQEVNSATVELPLLHNVTLIGWVILFFFLSIKCLRTLKVCHRFKLQSSNSGRVFASWSWSILCRI